MITTRFGICVVMIDAMTIAMPVESFAGAYFSEWFRTRLSPLLRSKAGQVKLWGLPKNVSLPKTLKNASLEILKIRS